MSGGGCGTGIWLRPPARAADGPGGRDGHREEGATAESGRSGAARERQGVEAVQLGQVLMVALAAPGTYLLLAVLQRVERSMTEMGGWPGDATSPQRDPDARN